jgi:hypothetical protein
MLQDSKVINQNVKLNMGHAAQPNQAPSHDHRFAFSNRKMPSDLFPFGFFHKTPHVTAYMSFFHLFLFS